MDIDLDAIIAWLIENWVIAAIAVGVIVLIIVVLKLLPKGKVRTDPEFPTEGPEANDIALGFLQIYNALGLWNDRDGKNMREGKEAARVRDMWGLNTSADVHANVQRLMTVRRRRPLWQTLLALRADAAQQAGGKPTRKQWMAAITAAGGTGRGEERAFVSAVEAYEKALTKESRTAFPADAYVTDFDAYALGQAVALSTWSVGLGLITRDESAALIREINEIARASYGSWAAFGQAYVLSRAMHWSDGVLVDRQQTDAEMAISDVETALDPRSNGPWASLPWRA